MKLMIYWADLTNDGGVGGECLLRRFNLASGDGDDVRGMGEREREYQTRHAQFLVDKHFTCRLRFIQFYL